MTADGKLAPRFYKKRLLKLADLLASLPRERFDFNTWGRAFDTVKPGTNLHANPVACGTTACAMGWAPSLPFAKKAGVELRAIDSTDWSYDNSFAVSVINAELVINGEYVDPAEVAKLLFDIGEDEFRTLFHPCATDDPTLDGGATPKRVARHIRKFVTKKYG